MTTQIQRRRGTTAEHSTFTGVVGELTVDTDKDTVVVHDGAAAGGHPLLREDGSNSALSLGTAGTPSIKFTGDTNTGIYSPGADQVAISTNGTGRLFVDASGNVGVGITPSNFLHLSGSNATQWVQIDGSASALLIGQNTANTHFGITSGTKIMANNASHPFAIGNNQAQPLILGTSSQERLRITSDGKVGVGTSSPQYLMHLSGGTTAGAHFY